MVLEFAINDASESDPSSDQQHRRSYEQVGDEHESTMSRKGSSKQADEEGSGDCGSGGGGLSVWVVCGDYYNWALQSVNRSLRSLAGAARRAAPPGAACCGGAGALFLGPVTGAVPQQRRELAGCHRTVL